MKKERFLAERLFIMIKNSIGIDSPIYDNVEFNNSEYSASYDYTEYDYIDNLSLYCDVSIDFFLKKIDKYLLKDFADAIKQKIYDDCRHEYNKEKHDYDYYDHHYVFYNNIQLNIEYKNEILKYNGKKIEYFRVKLMWPCGWKYSENII